MRIFSKITNKYYETVGECLDDERAYEKTPCEAEAEAEAEAKRAEREALRVDMKNKIAAAREEYEKLVKDYCEMFEDYSSETIPHRIIVTSKVPNENLFEE